MQYSENEELPCQRHTYIIVEIVVQVFWCSYIGCLGWRMVSRCCINPFAFRCTYNVGSHTGEIEDFVPCIWQGRLVFAPVWLAHGWNQKIKSTQGDVKVKKKELMKIHQKKHTKKELERKTEKVLIGIWIFSELVRAFMKTAFPNKARVSLELAQGTIASLLNFTLQVWSGTGTYDSERITGQGELHSHSMTLIQFTETLLLATGNRMNKHNGARKFSIGIYYSPEAW